MSLFLPETLELAKTSPVSTAWLHLPLQPKSWTVQSLHLVVTLGASEILGGSFIEIWCLKDLNIIIQLSPIICLPFPT